tara:strand:- start:419 stop:715 length:297 start_codon:yes stop_codon:yes gene_type:complete
MNKKEVDNHRYIVQSRLEESAISQASQGSDIKQLTITSASQGSDIKHIMETIDKVEILVKEQNGRVRSMEGVISGIKAIGAMISVIFSSLFAYLFTRS